MSSRLARALALGTLVFPSIGAVQAAQAQSESARSQARVPAVKTFSDGGLGYSIRLPVDWLVKTGLRTRDVTGPAERAISPTITFVEAPDAVALLAVLVKNGGMSTASIRGTESAMLKETRGTWGPIAFSTKRVNGVQYQLAETVTRTATFSLDQVAMAAVHGRHTYFFVGAVVLKRIVTATRTAQVRAALNSARLK